ncbi:MAG: primosomal protein N' [Clostridia bacterium]|nr:primosomal protein N' [Clostridia bacterium]
MFAQVIVDIVHENVARQFTYCIPEGMTLEIGTRVRVPFGSKTIEGIVTGLSESTDVPPDKLKEVISPLEEYPAVLPPLMELAEEIAAQHHCPLAETLRLMMPAVMRGDRIGKKTRKVVRSLVPQTELDKVLFLRKRAPKQQMLLTLLKDGSTWPVQALEALVKNPLDSLRILEKAGLVALEEEEVMRSPYAQTPMTCDPVLTPQQKEVLSEMEGPLTKGEGAFLLNGVTGSGKTEVYIRLVRRTLAMGKGAIILVPEIALTPQMVNWFRGRFGEVAAVMHSRLTHGERYDEWRRIRLGKARVVIGARSAVFAPVEGLGLIVVDEEHEQSYLSDRHPRYDAREVAHSRCRREGATLVLSSATPSILSFAKARRGDYMLLEMTRRVMNRPLPRVDIVDMREELKSGNRSIFSGLLYQNLKTCLEKGQQAVLFINRRGYNSFVSCRACGHVMKCPNCDISLTFHQSGGDGQMHCHYCGYQAPPPKQCPQCHSSYIRYFGIGTQRVEEEVKKLFPQTQVVRMDLDTTATRNAHEKLLGQFQRGEAQVLVGTQMIAKGLDFPRVTLVGVIAADMTLNLPDYRSPERTFQLLTQVAGRAGRGEEAGAVVIQTYKPEAFAIQAAASQDYRSFFETEFQRRRTGLYPPFTMLCRLLAEGDAEMRVQEAVKELYDACQAYLEKHPVQRKRVLMIRPDAAPVKMIRGKSRYHVLMKLFDHPDARAFMAFASQLAQQGMEGCQIYWEVNPSSLM